MAWASWTERHSVVSTISLLCSATCGKPLPAMPSFCPGLPGSVCIFSTSGNDAAARTQPGKHCKFCDIASLPAACLRQRLRASIAGLLAKFSPETQAAALARIPEEFQPYFTQYLAKQKRCRGLQGMPCAFALSAAGGRAHLKRRSSDTCLFCSPAELADKCQSGPGRRAVLSVVAR